MSVHRRVKPLFNVGRFGALLLVCALFGRSSSR
jgi:hypothetical protein